MHGHEVGEYVSVCGGVLVIRRQGVVVTHKDHKLPYITNHSMTAKVVVS